MIGCVVREAVPLLFEPIRIWISTSIQAAAQYIPFADASWEMWCWSGDLSAGSATLNLSPTAVTKLWTQRQKLLWGFLRRHQPVKQQMIEGSRGRQITPSDSEHSACHTMTLNTPWTQSDMMCAVVMVWQVHDVTCSVCHIMTLNIVLDSMTSNIVPWLWTQHHWPEEGVMLHTHLPQSLCCSVVQQLETNCRLKLVKLETQT